MSTWQLRSGTREDLPALLDIYNHYVVTSHATFDTEATTLAEREDWFEQYDLSGPHRLLVGARGDAVLGYAASSAFHPKPVYAGSVEMSIYLSPAHCAGGLGSRLYGSLIESLEAEPSVHRLYAGITLPNEASMALHLKLGFRVAASFTEISYKDGRFWDLCWLERAA